MVSFYGTLTVDFCDYLSNQFKDNGLYAFFDVILNPECRNTLRECAAAYLNSDGDDALSFLIKKTLRRYIDSNEFAKSLRKLQQFYSGSRQFETIDPPVIDRVFYSGEISETLAEFLRRERGAHSGERAMPPFCDSETLANSVRELFQDGGATLVPKRLELPIFHFMYGLSKGASLEIEFLDWLDDNPSVLTACKQETLSPTAFPECAALALFRRERNKSEEEMKKLVKSVREAYPLEGAYRVRLILRQLSSAIALLRNREKETDLSAYFYWPRNPEPYKAILTPLSTTSPHYRFLTAGEGLKALNDASGKRLHILCWERGLEDGETGYPISGISQRVKNLTERPPMLIIWKDDPQRAQAVNVSAPQEGEILEWGYLRRLIERIADSIESGQALDDIVNEARKMSAELKEKAREANMTKQDNSIHINNLNMRGDQVALQNAGSMSYRQASLSAGEKKRLLKEIAQAKDIITHMDALEDGTRETLRDSLDDATQAVREDSKAGQKDAAERFMRTAKSLADGGAKLIGALAGLASLAKFFGLGIPNG